MLDAPRNHPRSGLPETFAARFWPRVDRSAGASACWHWLGAVNSKGYGNCWALGDDGTRRTVEAHRIAYRLAKGAPRQGEVVRHRCHQPLCVNPRHLRRGSQAENMRDAHRAGRFADRIPAAVARRIVRARLAGAMRGEIIARFAIAPNVVHRVLTGERWSWATGIAPPLPPRPAGSQLALSLETGGSS